MDPTPTNAFHLRKIRRYIYIYLKKNTHTPFFSNTAVAEKYRSHAHEDRSVERGLRRETAGRFQHFVERLIEPCGVQPYAAMIADVSKQVKHDVVLRNKNRAHS
jgi:hypothetical protein